MKKRGRKVRKRKKVDRVGKEGRKKWTWVDGVDGAVRVRERETVSRGGRGGTRQELD